MSPPLLPKRIWFRYQRLPQGQWCVLILEVFLHRLHLRTSSRPTLIRLRQQDLIGLGDRIDAGVPGSLESSKGHLPIILRLIARNRRTLEDRLSVGNDPLASSQCRGIRCVYAPYANVETECIYGVLPE